MMTPDEKKEFLETIVDALACKIPANTLTDEESRWVRLAIKREAQSIQFRQKVIDNTLTGLLWLVVLAMGVILREWLNNHGLKF